MIPVFYPGTASFRSCLLLARVRLAFSQEAVRGLPSLTPRLVLHVMVCAQWFQAAREKCLLKR